MVVIIRSEQDVLALLGTKNINYDNNDNRFMIETFFKYYRGPIDNSLMSKVIFMALYSKYYMHHQWAADFLLKFFPKQYQICSSLLLNLQYYMSSFNMTFDEWRDSYITEHLIAYYPDSFPSVEEQSYLNVILVKLLAQFTDGKIVGKTFIRNDREYKLDDELMNRFVNWEFLNYFGNCTEVLKKYTEGHVFTTDTELQKRMVDYIKTYIDDIIVHE